MTHIDQAPGPPQVGEDRPSPARPRSKPTTTKDSDKGEVAGVLYISPCR